MSNVVKIIFASMLISLVSLTSAFAESEWSRDISLGYNRSTGNTEKSELNVAAQAKRAMTDAEFLLKGEVYYSSADDSMDAQKWNALSRYSFDFGEEMNWFNSYQILADHDYFADIDYRITPSSGVGYWFSKDDDYKLMAECSLGYEITNYRSAKADDEEAVLIGRIYLDKKVFENSRFSEDFTVTPSLEESGVRIKSETVFSNPIAENMDLNVKFVVEHDTEPPAGIKSTDTRLMTGIKYSF